MGKAVHHLRRDTVRFWACFAVVMALFSQVLFPPQVMAAQTASGTRFFVCSAGINGAPIADAATAKLFKSLGHTSGLQGLKCANCVLSSLTATTAPSAVFIPVVYAVAHADFRQSPDTSVIKARSPPRPHSCGPPLQTQDS